MLQGGNKRLGDWGESQASSFLERHGFYIVERNYHTPAGEIDIVARKSDDYYFIEVKTRQAGAMAFDVAVTSDKKHKLRKTVRAYCYRRRVTNVGIILASLMVIVDRVSKIVSFRLAVLY